MAWTSGCALAAREVSVRYERNIDSIEVVELVEMGADGGWIYNRKMGRVAWRWCGEELLNSQMMIDG